MFLQTTMDYNLHLIIIKGIKNAFFFFFYSWGND